MSGLGQNVDLTNDEEVQEYLKNLGAEYRFGCYSENNAEACQLLGEYMESVTREFTTAFKVFEANCVKNSFAPSCNKAGHYKVTGKDGVNKDIDLGYKYLKQSCDGNFHKGCYLAGMFHKIKFDESDKVTTKQDLKEGFDLLQKGCDLGNVDACYSHAAIGLRGGKGFPRNPEAAAKSLEKGCEMAHPHCCQNLAIMYKKGDGVPKDLSIAQKFMARTKEIHEEAQTRLKFQEGVETAGNTPVKD